MFHEDSNVDWDNNYDQPNAQKSKSYYKTNKPRHNKQHENENRREHFSIDNTIHVKLDLDFAIDLGNFLLECDNQDKRFKSFGHNLRNLSLD